MQEYLTFYGKIYSSDKTAELLQQMLTEFEWQSDFVAFGRRFDMPRRQAWFADEGVHYRYSDNMLNSHSWTEPLLAIKNDIEMLTGYPYNSVLVTYYHDGDDHVSWHADDEFELGEKPVIASLSLGASRQFQYRHKLTRDMRSTELHDGELLLMRSYFQHNWEHCVPVEPVVTEQRINLTFRNVMVNENDIHLFNG